MSRGEIFHADAYLRERKSKSSVFAVIFIARKLRYQLDYSLPRDGETSILIVC